MGHLEKSSTVACCPMLLCQEDPEDSASVAEIARGLWRGKWIVLAASLLAGAAAAYMAFMVLPKTYKAEATLQPAAQTESSAVGRLLGNLPLGLGAGAESSKVTSMMNFLKSNALAERLIVKYDLLPLFYGQFWDAERKTWTVDGEKRPTLVKALQAKILDDVLSVKVSKETTLIVISCVSRDPVFAAEMVSRAIDELKSYLDKEYVSDARREREFVEKQLQETTKELEFWEASIPTPQLTQSKITRELAAAQAVYAELRRQLALAQISETKDVISFKVLDRPFVPEVKYGPKRLLIVVGGVIGGGFLATLLLLVRQLVRGGSRPGRETAPARSNETAA